MSKLLTCLIVQRRFGNCYLLFIIIVTECDVLSPSTKFSPLHHTKGGGTAS